MPGLAKEEVLEKRLRLCKAGLQDKVDLRGKAPRVMQDAQARMQDRGPNRAMAQLQTVLPTGLTALAVKVQVVEVAHKQAAHPIKAMLMAENQAQGQMGRRMTVLEPVADMTLQTGPPLPAILPQGKMADQGLALTRIRDLATRKTIVAPVVKALGQARALMIGHPRMGCLACCLARVMG